MQNLEKALQKDSITNLRNRRHFLEQFDKLFKESKTGHYPLSLLIVRISSLDIYSALYGPDLCDEVCEKTANSFVENSDGGTLLGRLKYEHFGAIWPDTPITLAHKHARKITSGMRSLYSKFNEEKNIDIKFWATLAKRDPDDTNYISLLKRGVKANISLDLDASGQIKVIESSW